MRRTLPLIALLVACLFAVANETAAQCPSPDCTIQVDRLCSPGINFGCNALNGSECNDFGVACTSFGEDPCSVNSCWSLGECLEECRVCVPGPAGCICVNYTKDTCTE